VIGVQQQEQYAQAYYNQPPSYPSYSGYYTYEAPSYGYDPYIYQPTTLYSSVQPTTSNIHTQHSPQSSGQAQCKKRHVRQRKGPLRANLYVFNLPEELTDVRLLTLFQPFGNIISAKICIDMNTGKSKGFGELYINQNLTPTLIETIFVDLIERLCLI